MERLVSELAHQVVALMIESGALQVGNKEEHDKAVMAVITNAIERSKQ